MFLDYYKVLYRVLLSNREPYSLSYVAYLFLYSVLVPPLVNETLFAFEASLHSGSKFPAKQLIQYQSSLVSISSILHVEDQLYHVHLPSDVLHLVSKTSNPLILLL